ncbi:MAG: hypothetical protein ABL907_02425 [Hyphomicrobium sp.]
MARDLSEQEREFIDALAGDTGQGLDAWMLAIAASGHAGRNDIIDWLRQKGFAFSKASWLERIHHNGGRLIYGDLDMRAVGHERVQAQVAQVTARAERTPELKVVAGPTRQNEPERPATVRAEPKTERLVTAAGPAGGTNGADLNVPVPAVAPAASEAEIDTLLTAAKGLRPLALLVLRELEQLLPGVVRQAAPPFLLIASPVPFAALLPAPKDVRLYADFGPATRDRTRKAESTRIAAPFPDCLVVNDARQIDDRFRELLAAAYTRSLK